MAHTPFRFRRRMLFFLEKQFLKGPHYQLLFVAVLIGLISVIAGLLVWPLKDESLSLGQSIWWAFLRLSDPGYLGDDEGVWRRIVSTTLTVMGYVIFLGSLVAIITTWLNAKMRHIERGTSPVISQGHVAILGWTSRTIPVVAELYASSARVRGFLRSHGRRALRLIILCDQLGPERLQELKDNRMIGKRAHEIILRSGVPIDPEHLRRIDCMNAAAIILPNQAYASRELITPDVEAIKTLLTLNAEGSHMSPSEMPLVVAELQDEKKISAARRSYSGPLEVIASNAVMSRLVAQVLRHPGLSLVFSELLSRGMGSNIYAVSAGSLVGRTFGECRKALPKSILLGLVRRGEAGLIPMLRAPDGMRLEEHDHLIILARRLQEAQIPMAGSRTQDAPPGGSSAGSASAKMQGPRSAKVRSRKNLKMLILGWNEHIPSLIHELGNYGQDHYDISLVSLRSIEERERKLQALGPLPGNVKTRQLLGDHVKESELKQLEPHTFDSILLGSSDRLSDEEEADARTIVTYMLLQELLPQNAKGPQVLLEIASPGNARLIDGQMGEVLVGPVIMSHLLAQIALKRELACVFEELLSVGETEIDFCTVEHLGISSGSYSFAALAQKAASADCILLGLLLATNGNSKLRLNPRAEELFTLSEEDRLVVLQQEAYGAMATADHEH